MPTSPFASPLSLWDTIVQALSPASAEAEVVARDQQSRQLLDAMAKQTVTPSTALEPNPLIRGQFSPLRKQLYSEIANAAERRPETASMGFVTPEALLQKTQNPATLGLYETGTGDIHLKNTTPWYLDKPARQYREPPSTALPFQEVAAHELLHFLQSKLGEQWGKTGTPAWNRDLAWWQRLLGAQAGPNSVQEALMPGDPQHRFIQYVLGSSQAPADNWQELETKPWYQPFATPPTQDVQQQHVYEEALKQIIQDPTLLQQAIQGLRRPPTPSPPSTTSTDRP